MGLDDMGERVAKGCRWSRLAELVVSCCQSSPSVRPSVRSPFQLDTNPTAFRGRRWIHAFLLSEGAPPRGLKAETHPNCVRETGQSATRVCVRASARSKEQGGGGGGGGGRRRRREMKGRLCPEPGVQFRFPPLVRRATALWQSTRCTTKFGGLNKLGGRPSDNLEKPDNTM